MDRRKTWPYRNRRTTRLSGLEDHNRTPRAYRKIIEICLYGVEAWPKRSLAIRGRGIGIFIGPYERICCYILEIPRKHRWLELYDEIVVLFRMNEHPLKTAKNLKGQEIVRVFKKSLRRLLARPIPYPVSSRALLGQEH